MRFLIYTDDVENACKVLDEFVRIANEEFEKSRMLRIWRKVSSKVKVPCPTFSMHYDLNENNVIVLYLEGAVVTRDAARKKLVEYLKKSFDAKNVKISKIDVET